MNYAFISNYLSRSIYVYLLDYLELRLDLLFKTGFYYKEKVIKVDVNIFESQVCYIQPINFLPLSL